MNNYKDTYDYNNYNTKNHADTYYNLKNNENMNLFNSKINNNIRNNIRMNYENNDLSKDARYKNGYISNINNTNYRKKISKDFNLYKRNNDIYNTMKNYQVNNRMNRFNQSIPYMPQRINKNAFIYKEEYDDEERNDFEEYEFNYKYDKNYYLDKMNNNININIEDLLILEERLKEIIYFLKSIKDVRNQCYDFWNFLFYSSLTKLQNVYKNEELINTIKLCINLELLSIMLCYEFSFDEIIMNKTYILLLEILEINHNTLINICENVLHLSKKENSESLWVELLQKLVSDSTNPKEKYNKILPFYEKLNLNNDKLIKKIKDILFRYQTNLSSLILSLLKKINQKNYEQINDFFQEYILRKENIFNTKTDLTNQARPPFILSQRKKKFTLILGLNETLIHLQQINYNQCSLKLRPYLFDFLENLKPYYELILFTSKTKYYTIPVMKVIQRNKIYFDFIFYREHCITLGNDYVKDLTRIGRSLDSTIIVDNLPQHFKLQKENGINIKSFWAQDPNDRALYDLIPILINIALEENDVRDGLEKYKEDIVGRITSNIFEQNLI